MYLAISSQANIMNWLINLSVGNRIALASLVIAVLGVFVAVFDFKTESKPPSELLAPIIEKTKNETAGKNSPIINDVNGDVEINFK